MMRTIPETLAELKDRAEWYPENFAMAALRKDMANLIADLEDAQATLKATEQALIESRANDARSMRMLVEAEEKLAAAEKDSARLDYLQDRRSTVHLQFSHQRQGIDFVVGGMSQSADERLRTAIDAASAVQEGRDGTKP